MVLIMLFMLMVTGALSITLIYLLYKRNYRMSLWMGSILIFIWGINFIGILGFSILSHDRLLGINEQKRFSGFYLDEHLAAQVEDIQKLDSLIFRSPHKADTGDYYVVSLKVSSNARRATLRLHHPIVKVIDGEGREYKPYYVSFSGNKYSVYQKDCLAEAVGPSHPFFTRNIVFELPKNVDHPKLSITEGEWPDRIIELFLAGDEDSLFHKRTYFSMDSESNNNRMAGGL
jgi:hypothetical protein